MTTADEEVMGLFSRKEKEPVVHAEVRRYVYVPAEAEAVTGQLQAYSELHSPKHADQQLLRLSSADGWVRVELPRCLHPWTFHNVAYWLLDTDGADNRVVAVSETSPHHPGYRLVRDPEMPDGLCGIDDSGQHWSIAVPTNDVVRGDEVPARDTYEIPPDPDFTSACSVEALMEDPGHDLNPTNTSTFGQRKHLRSVGFEIY